MGILLQFRLISVPGKTSPAAGLRDLFLICRKTWHLLMFYNGPNGRLSFYYKSAIFICFHKAYYDCLPDTLIDLILKKRATNYSTRTCASIFVKGTLGFPAINISLLESFVIINAALDGWDVKRVWLLFAIDVSEYFLLLLTVKHDDVMNSSTNQLFRWLIPIVKLDRFINYCVLKVPKVQML